MYLSLPCDKAYQRGDFNLEQAKSKKKKKNRVRLWEGRLSVSLACKLNGLRVLKYRVL